MIRKNFVWVLSCTILAVGTLTGFGLYYAEKAKTDVLEQQLVELSQKEKESVIVQHISTQMEEIAREQQVLSDERRKEAEQQTIVANEMRLQAEQEQHRAQEAELAARLSERKAVEASDVAETQRQLAVQRQREAEYSRSVADTLSYLTMARSLGTLAVTQQSTGNHDLAALLAYAAYTYTKRYHGNVYQPAIYEALAQTSSNSRIWNIGHGAIMKRATFTDRTNEFVTISTYGEIIRHSVKESQLLSETLLANAKYDFRDLYIKPDGTIYAVSYSGSLIIIRPNGRMEEHPLTTAIHPFRIFIPSDNALIIAAEQSILLFDDKQQKVVKTMPLQFSTKVAGNKDDEVVLFDQAGKMYLIDKTLSTITPQSLPFLQPVMSYIYQTNTGRAAYGTVDGTIYYFDSKGKMQKLVGHRSRVSRLKFYEDQLLSVSYDGTARFWDVASEKIEPITLLQSDQWIISSSYGSNRDYAWTGDANGNLTLTLIQPDLMAQNVQNSLKRDFTQEEWAYYIGSKIPYESFLSKRKGL